MRTPLRMLLAGLTLAALMQFAAAAEPDLRKQVADAERAFAKTMADRDFTAFRTFLADEAIFFSGERAHRGKAAVAQASGPVRDPSGKIVGRFNSIWRLEAPGTWRVVFDKGCDVCQQCADKPSA